MNYLNQTHKEALKDLLSLGWMTVQEIHYKASFSAPEKKFSITSEVEKWINLNN